MKLNFLILIIYFRFIYNNEKDFSEGVYQIDSLLGLTLVINALDMRIIFKRNFLKNYFFRLIPLNLNQYYIESVTLNKRLAVHDNEIFLSKDFAEVEEEIWNIIKINNNEFLIQNNATKRLIKYEKLNKCILSESLEEILSKNISRIDEAYKFSILKLYEEVKLKPEHLAFIEKEPVDVVIKYIDLSDKTLNREGIKQINKDEDNEELRYSVRSIFKYIPWIRKIFIVMPNEKVKYFKPKEDIKDKIIYVKDKDLIGFDSSNSFVFQFFLWNLRKFGVSDNFILMDDDYFIGKSINKSQFFYYDEDMKKVVPCIISDEFHELKRNEVLKEYNKLFSKKDKIDPHTAEAWYLHTAAVFKFFLEQYNQTLISGGFTHNAISLNIDDIKEVFDLIKNKYEYANENLYSKTRNVFNLQSQTMFNTYSLNIKKRKVNPIKRKFIDLRDLPKNQNLDIELFVINKSGENKYEEKEYLYEKQVLNMKYSEKTNYEIDDNFTIQNESLLIEQNDTTISNKTINSGIIQGIKNKSFIEINFSVYENNLELRNNKINKNTKENHKKKLFNFFLIFFVLAIIALSIIIIKDLFCSNLKRNGIYDFEERNSLKKKKFSSKNI